MFFPGKANLKIFLTFLCFVLILVFYLSPLAHKIDLSTLDLGRHLKNGQEILEGNFKVLSSNFYSYTNPDYPFLNHHWGSGLIFFLVQKAFGFRGLSLFYLVLSLIAFFLFFDLARRESNIWLAFLISLFFIPLISSRAEIRPEIFSYLFSGLVFWLLWNYKKEIISYKCLFLLPLIELFWVNLHIYFFLGIFIIGIFWFSELLPKQLKNLSYSKERLKNVSLAFFLSILAALVNPFGLKGVLYPFNIFRNYGYRVLENQPVWFLQKLTIFNNSILLYFEIASLFILTAFVLLFLLNRPKFSWLFFTFFLFFDLAAWLAFRNFALFAFFAIPLASFVFRNLLVQRSKFGQTGKNLLMTVFVILALIISYFDFSCFLKRPANPGLGLAKENESAADFFEKNQLKGPIFNDYDIGGYLIYYLYPKEKVFVDNRPEAYPSSFFKKIYIPLQQNDEIWKEYSRKYNFQVIFFSYHDFTPWGQDFLIKRLNDPDWLPVFASHQALIFLKNNNQNKSVIDKYELPRNYFRVIKLK